MATDNQRRLREIELLEEIVIKALYLSMEIRDACATSDVAPPEASLAASEVLRGWALRFSESLRARRRAIEEQR